MEPALRKVAWTSWSAEDHSISLESADLSGLQPAIGLGVLVNDGVGWKFADPNVMVAGATEYLLDLEGPSLLVSPIACFERLEVIWAKEIGKENTVSGQVLAELHNSGEIDAFAWAREAVEGGVRTWDVLHVLEGAIPHFLRCDARTIYKLFAERYRANTIDLGGGALYPKLEQWLPRHPDVAREIARLHELNPGDRCWGLYGAAMHALVLHNFEIGFQSAVAAVDSPERLIGGPALSVLGLLDYSLPDRQHALETTLMLCSAIVKNPRHPLLSGAITTAGRLVDYKESEVGALLEESARGRQPEALHALSDFVFQRRKDFWDKPWFWPMFMHLVTAEDKSTLDNVDFVLASWLKHPGRVPKVLEFLGAWIGKQSSEAIQEPGLAKVFDSTVHRLCEVPGALGIALTVWLTNSDSRYPLAASNVISKLRVGRVESFALDTDILNTLSESDFRFLLRRILGYLFGHDVVLPLVYSMLHTRDAKQRTFGFFLGVVRDRVGYDYPEEALAFLREKEQAADTPSEVKELCAFAIEEIRARRDAESAVPILKEFFPSPEKVRRYAKERRRQMSQALEEAEQSSIFRQIVTEIQLKAGRRTFQWFHGRYTDIMELKEISHSIPMPRTEVADPMGSARERHLFRHAKDGEA